jgi:TolB-like protein/DNA-binding winged helix-turn-helix (wHTH) protein
MAITPPEIRFDAFVIDPAGRRLLREQRPVALEPKAFDVLALLAGAPGRAFTRDEILDAVWGHRHVTPGVLNRIVTLLRHALGEDAHAPRYLRTLHGVGYRFDLPPPVAAADATEGGAASIQHAGDPAGTGAAEPADPQIFAGTDRRRAPAPPPPAPPARDRRAMVSLALVLGAVLAAWGWQRYAAAPRAPENARAPATQRPTPATAHGLAATSATAAAAEPTLIVMPLDPIGDDASTRDLAAGLSDELITELARVRGLRVIARESTSLAATDTHDLAALVPRLAISHALEGSLARGGEHLRVRLRLTDARDGRTLWAQDYDRAATDALQLQRDVARAVAAALALNLGLAGDTPARGNAAFLRRYFAARQQLNAARPRQLDASRALEAEFRALVREQPDDGRSHAGLAAALELRAFYSPATAAGIRREAAREADIALRLDPDLADALRVQAAGACRGDDWERCLRLYERAQSLSPGESRPQFEYAMALAALGYLDRALAVMRAGADSDPLNEAWRFGQVRILDTLGRHAEAHALLPAVPKGAPYARWFNAAWRRDFAEALRLAQAMAARSGDTDPYEAILRPSYVAVSRALADPSAWPAARQRMRESEQQTGLMNFLRVMEPGAQPAQVIAGLEEVRHRSYSSWDLLLWTRDLRALRQDPAFGDYLRRSGILAYWQRNGFPAQCRPAGGGAACD